MAIQAIQFVQNLKNRVLSLKQEGNNKSEIYDILQNDGIFGTWEEGTASVIYDKLDSSATYSTLANNHPNYQFLIWLTNSFDPTIDEYRKSGKNKNEIHDSVKSSKIFYNWLEQAIGITYDAIDGKSPRVLSVTYSMYNDIHPVIIMLLTGSHDLATPQRVVSNKFEARVNPFIARWQGRPDLAFPDNETILVVWHSVKQDGSGRAVLGQMLDFNLIPKSPHFIINTETQNEQRRPSASCQLGICLVVWQSDNQDGSNAGIFGQLVRADGVLIGDEFQANIYTQNTQNNPIVKNLGDTGFVVVWNSWYQDGSRWGVFGRIFTLTEDGVKGSDNEIQVNTHFRSSQNNPDIISYPDKFTVVWQSVHQDGSGTGIFARKFDLNGVPIDIEEYQINTYTQGSQFSPSADSFSDESSIIVWFNTTKGLSGQRFDSNHETTEDEFSINEYEFLKVYNDPSVAILQDLYFWVVWSAITEDSGHQIYGKLLHKNGKVAIDEFKTNGNKVSNIPFSITDCHGDSCFVVYRGKNGTNHDIYISAINFVLGEINNNVIDNDDIS